MNSASCLLYLPQRAKKWHPIIFTKNFRNSQENIKRTPEKSTKLLFTSIYVKQKIRQVWDSGISKNAQPTVWVWSNSFEFRIRVSGSGILQTVLLTKINSSSMRYRYFKYCATYVFEKTVFISNPSSVYGIICFCNSAANKNKLILCYVILGMYFLTSEPPAAPTTSPILVHFCSAILQEWIDTFSPSLTI